MSKYFHNLAVAIDQLANTLLAGYPDETLSSRSWRCREKKRWAIAVKIINSITFNSEHCKEAAEKEIDLPYDDYNNAWDKKY